MKKIILLFSFLFLLMSCNNGVVKKPKKLIDQEKMIDILYDLTILDAIRNHNYDSGTNNLNSNAYIFKKYEIDSLQFAENNKYYASDISKYKRMFNKVNERLTEKNQELTKKTPVNGSKSNTTPQAIGSENGQIK